jgi:hypothetical protein
MSNTSKAPKGILANIKKRQEALKPKKAPKKKK